VSLCLGNLCASACDPFDAPAPVGFDLPPASDVPAAGDAGAPPEIDTDTALAAIVDGGFRGGAFTHATRAPYPSSAAPGSFVDEWVSSASYAEYAQVQPDAGDSGIEMPPGSMVVRAVVDSNDDVSKLTVMLKGPPGYNPALGDWWFAATDPSGVPLSDDAGVLAGRLTGCYSCHLPRSGDDFLFGVPLDDRPASE
jgi:hypothetical protein